MMASLRKITAPALNYDITRAHYKFDGKTPYIEVSEPRMYYLVRSPSFGGHLVALQPEGPGLTLHSFTFPNNCQLADKP
jgi:hypothetical protein